MIIEGGGGGGGGVAMLRGSFWLYAHVHLVIYAPLLMHKESTMHTCTLYIQTSGHLRTHRYMQDSCT